jgi:ankyrin repeat protein
MSAQPSLELWHAARMGDTEGVRNLLKLDPDVNWNDRVLTPLHMACLRDYEGVVSLLVRHPGINLEAEGRMGHTPIFSAMVTSPGQKHLYRALRIMLRRGANVNHANRLHRTVFWLQCFHGDIDGMAALLAERDDVDIDARGMDRAQSRYYTPSEAAKERGHDHAVKFLASYRADPDRVRFRLKLSKEYPDARAAYLFGLVVFFSDGLLSVGGQDPTGDVSRFFSVAQRLPMELQMILCHRVFDSSLDFVSQKLSEAAFKEIARLRK